MPKKIFTSLILLSVLSAFGCAEKIERSGIIIDQSSGESIEGVSIDIYRMHQKRDSLKEKVFTDSLGQFQILEKIGKHKLFLLRKEGYIGYVNSLSGPNDTIRMEKLLVD